MLFQKVTFSYLKKNVKYVLSNTAMQLLMKAMIAHAPLLLGNAARDEA